MKSAIRIALLVPLLIACGLTLAAGAVLPFAACALLTLLVAIAK